MPRYRNKTTQIKRQKIKLLKIWEILNRKTDKDHPISTQELLVELEKIDIKCDRRTIYKDIDALQETGYDVKNRRRSRDMVYWIDNKSFDLPELKMIIDAIKAANFITLTRTEQLIDKLASLGGSSRNELLKRKSIQFNVEKNTNDQIYNNVYQLKYAIKHKKRFHFIILHLIKVRVFSIRMKRIYLLRNHL